MLIIDNISAFIDITYTLIDKVYCVIDINFWFIDNLWQARRGSGRPWNRDGAGRGRSGQDGVGRGRSGLVGEQERTQIRSGWVRRSLRRTQLIDNGFRFIDKRAIYRQSMHFIDKKDCYIDNLYRFIDNLFTYRQKQLLSGFYRKFGSPHR